MAEKVWNGGWPSKSRCLVLHSLVQNGGYESAEEGRWLGDRQREQATCLGVEDRPWSREKQVNQKGLLSHSSTPKYPMMPRLVSPTALALLCGQHQHPPWAQASSLKDSQLGSETSQEGPEECPSISITDWMDLPSRASVLPTSRTAGWLRSHQPLLGGAIGPHQAPLHPAPPAPPS